MNTRRNNNSIKPIGIFQKRMNKNIINSREPDYRVLIERTLIKFTICLILFMAIIIMKNINTRSTNYVINLLQYRLNESFDIVEVYGKAKAIAAEIAKKGEKTLEVINLKTNYSIEFLNPMEGEITTFFQEEIEGSNTISRGIIIKGEMGENIIATQEGVVIEVGNTSSGGHYIIIKHRGELLSVYKNLESYLVEKDQKIIMGEVIGTSSGKLQFEVWNNKKPVDPLSFINLNMKNM